MIFFKGIPPAWKESSEKKGLKFAAFDFFPFTNNGGDHFANVGRVVQESIQHFFLWDFLCKQMNIYVELRIIWDKAKFIRGNMKNQNGHKWSGFWKLLKHILEQNMFYKCQSSGIRTRSGGKIKMKIWKHYLIWQYYRKEGRYAIILHLFQFIGACS